MKTWAVIKNGVVVDVIAWDGQEPFTPSQDTELVEFDVDGVSPPGREWTYDGQEFIPPKNE